MTQSPFSNGVVVQATLFLGDQPFSVEVLSSSPIANGATAKIILGRIDESTQAQLGIADTVTLKLFVNNIADYQQQLLRRELRTVRQVRHPYILPYTGSAVFDFHDILISPYMKNGNLLDYLSGNVVDCGSLLFQVATAVNFLHTKHKIIHGDLKCENLLVSDDGSALLADFGLSTFTEQTAMHTRSATALRLLMTLRFAAPELLFGSEIREGVDTKRPARRTVKTDVYAFGMMIVQAFTRQSPWAGYTIEQIMVHLYMRVTHPRPEGSVASLDIPDSWWNVCLYCWCYAPSLRPSMQDVLDVLAVSPLVNDSDPSSGWEDSVTLGRTILYSPGVAGTDGVTFPADPTACERIDRDVVPYLEARDYDRLECAPDSSRGLPLPAGMASASHLPPALSLQAVTASERPHAMDTDVSPTPKLLTATHDCVIAVVGAAGCGKSTVIRGGFASWGLLEEPLGITIGSTGREMEVLSRSAIVALSRKTDDGLSQTIYHTFQVLEVDTSMFDYSQLGVWLPGMPVVDGVLVCYDASDSSSFTSIPALLRRYTALGIVVVLLACKSDRSPKTIMPQHANEFSRAYNIGLIEVSSETDVGQRKMRDCFHWVMKAISRTRRSQVQQNCH